MSFKRFSMIAGLTMGVGASQTSFGYNLIGWDWTWKADPMNEPINFNDGSFPSSVGTQSEVNSAFESAIDVWNTEGDAGFSFNYTGTTSQTSWSNDNDNYVYFSDTNGGGSTIALTQSWGSWGDMTDADIRIYDRNAWGDIDWTADANGAGFFETDLETVIIHELGHVAGLDHSSNNNAIMYGSVPSAAGPAERHLHSDDINGLQAMYGAVQSDELQLDLTSGALVANATATYEATGADANEKVYFVATFAGEGNGPCPWQIGFQCMLVQTPLWMLGSDFTNNSGEAVLTITLPANYAGEDLSVQAAIIRGVAGADSITSNALTNPVAAGGGGACADPDDIEDCGNDCYPAIWVGDGFCDDGSNYIWGSPDFDCAAYNDDGGDC